MATNPIVKKQAGKAKGGKKNRKIGRNKKSPSAVRYLQSDKCAVNKERNILRDKKVQARAAKKRQKRAAKI